jgi:hypothetical protein
MLSPFELEEPDLPAPPLQKSSGTPNRKLARDVRAQATQALAALAGGLADYGIKSSC